MAESRDSFLPDYNCRRAYEFFKLSPKRLQSALGESLPTIMGGMIGMKRSSRSYSNIVPVWFECSKEAACFAPPECSIKNHRFDQTALNLIVRTLQMAGESVAVQTDQLKWVTSWNQLHLLPEHPSLRSEMNWFLRRAHVDKPFSAYIRRRYGQLCSAGSSLGGSNNLTGPTAAYGLPVMSAFSAAARTRSRL